MHQSIHTHINATYTRLSLYGRRRLVYIYIYIYIHLHVHTQWETAFAGVSRMIKTFFDILCSLDTADRAWQSFLSHMQTAVVQGSEQVRLLCVYIYIHASLSHMHAAVLQVCVCVFYVGEVSVCPHVCVCVHVFVCM